MIQTNKKRLYEQFDWFILLLLLLLCGIGILTIYSATRPAIESVHPNFYIKQAVWVGCGLIALIFVVFIDYSFLRTIAYPSYIIGLAILLFVLVAGQGKMGARRWLNLGFISFQPTEFFRLIFIVALAKYLSSFKGLMTMRNFAFAVFAFAIPPFILIMKQPDLGSGLILIILFVMIVLARGIEKKFLIQMVITCIIVVPIFGSIVFGHLKEYQRNRIIAFIDSEADPQGIGYQIEQSRITIGSGMVTGKGYLKGTQGPLRFLPEKHTDFIFSVFAEEWGFLGVTVVFMLYFLLFMRGIDTSLKAKDDFGKMIAIGLTFMLFIYFTINTGMVLGIMPVVGVPLPFISYGGTTLIANFMTIGLLINIRMRRLGLLY
ncbi:MAG: rod shape-determining protein RodA [Nitrospirae bacterium]|nr:rod shape-determining protein RodA [Nitrospirota bacterium]MBF0540443.1 rod shape-determining protein RodA [Nitrospirota bacterium]